jgi:hypothetical protein
MAGILFASGAGRLDLDQKDDFFPFKLIVRQMMNS